jgi:hypothetical protein
LNPSWVVHRDGGYASGPVTVEGEYLPGMFYRYATRENLDPEPVPCPPPGDDQEWP